MRKKKILIHTNPPWLKTGLAENGRELAKYLHKTGKFEVIYYASQTNEADPMCQTTPWKTYGCIPSNPQIIQQLNNDQGKARDAAYGGLMIEEIIKKEKIDIYWGSDDIWMAPFFDRPWFKKINSVLHITVDSLPILDQAYAQAKATPHYYTWAKFAQKEMHRIGPEFANVKQIYGVADGNKFRPITKEQKNELRKRFNIGENTVIFGYLFRNQLRKGCSQAIQAFSQFKKENPNADVKLHLHTNYAEKGSGWDIPKLMAYFGVDQKDVLATYVCKECHQWLVHPYVGDDIDCPICGAKKSMITPSIQHGVSNEDLHLIYGLWDAGLSIFTSGGLEYHNVNTLLCGLPLASTNYSSGEDFCEQSFVTALDYEPTFEAGTNFIKAATSIKSIKNFIEQIYQMPEEKRREIGQKGREWAVKTFSIDTIGKQWEDLFDSLPLIDWDKVDLEEKPTNKNPNFQLPPHYQEMPEDEFITLIYKEILGMDERAGVGEGHRYWKSAISQGRTRNDIVKFFRDTAIKELTKPQQIEFDSLIDKSRPNKRALFVIKQSLGDCLMVTQLFESFHEKYPNTDLYVGTDPANFEIFEGNPFIYKVLPYQPFMENEMIVISAGQKPENKMFDYFFHPGILSQRHLQYLSINNIKK